MRPTKNRYFCIDCLRTKMLFKTEEKAINFLTYNRKIILLERDYAPIRAYHCESCDGWHLSSRLRPPETRTHQIFYSYRSSKKKVPIESTQSIKKFQEMLKRLEWTISDVQSYRRSKDYEHCFELMELGFKLLNRAKKYGGRNLKRDALGKCLETIKSNLEMQVA